MSYYRFIVSPSIIKSTYAQVETQATSYVSDAIKEAMNISNLGYDDFIDVKYNSQGNVASMMANTYNLNLFARETAVFAQQYVDKIIDEGVNIPIGTFSGLSFLAGKGMKVRFNLVPIGSIHVGFRSNFDSKGINQTLHSLAIVTTCEMTVILPFESKIIKFETDFKVCENLIVGQVPEFYLSGDLL